MKEDVSTVKDYINALSQEKKHVINRLRKTIQANLPKGFEETCQYHMISYVVPLSLYPKGYLNKKDTPLPLLSLEAQKHHIAIYHMALYMSPNLMRWFKQRYQETVNHRLDMGKSCIRFKHLDDIPYELIGELVAKITPKEFILQYESVRK
ncbi:MAG: DUF1801 domain-containing protein [Candidatus Izemoplasma sp.]|nr:DUF1801 domain-containing protein [Candidatus Izemoplasma sp.]